MKISPSDPLHQEYLTIICGVLVIYNRCRCLYWGSVSDGGADSFDQSLTESFTHSLSKENAGAGAECCQFSFQTLVQLVRMAPTVLYSGCKGQRAVTAVYYERNHWKTLFEIEWQIWSLAINRPGVATAVRQTALSLSDPFPPNLQNIINLKLLKLESWNVERMFTPHQVSHVTVHLSCVTCHMSYVICFLFFVCTKSWS